VPELDIFLITALGAGIAGMLSSIVGLGGALVMVALLSTVLSPQEVLALTAPVLLLGNLDRIAMHRRVIDWGLLPWFLAGSVPTVAIGSLLLPYLPASALRLAMATLLGVFVLSKLRPGRAGGHVGVTIPLWGFTVLGLFHGVLASTVGGGGPLSAPFVYGRVKEKAAFVGTEATLGLSVNVVKTGVFLATGLLLPVYLWTAVFATLMMMLGNRAGRAILSRLAESTFQRILLLTMLLLAVRLGIVGVQGILG
jgi:uncharacterized membrane protein YfcA